MRTVGLLFSVLFLLGCSQASETPPDAAPVIAAERAFAAEARQIGWVEAFERHSTAEAIVLGARPRNAHEAMAGIDPANRGDTSLSWAPEFAGVSRGGDIGFTTGPFNGGDAAFGQYFTVWRRQADGSWKWIYDGGTNQTTPNRPDPAFAVEELPVGARGAGSAAAALEAVHRREEALAAAAAESAGEAYAELFAATGRMNRDEQPTAVGPEAAEGLAGAGPVRFSPPQMAEAGAAGDLVFTLGEARWEGGSGYYQRIWVLQRDGWRIGYDQILLRSLEEMAPPVESPTP
jgi:ketosteroid isomerase-like protein